MRRRKPEMTTYDATVSMLRDLSESDLLKVQAYVGRFLYQEAKDGTNEEGEFNPFVPLSEDEIYDQLAVAREHAGEERTKSAKQVSINIM